VKTALNLLSHQNCDHPKCKAVLGEMEIHRSHAGLFTGQLKEAMASAKVAVDFTPKDHTYVMGAALTAYGLSAQALGKTEEALHILNEFIPDDSSGRGPTVQRALLTIAWISCLSGDWNTAFSTAEHVLKLTQANGSVLMQGWSHLIGGWYLYEQNELDAATQHFDAIVQQRYNGVHWRCAISGLCGLGLSYWALGRMDRAKEVAHMLDEYTLESRDVDQIAVAQTFRAHLDVLAGHTAPALHWAQTGTDQFDFRPFLWTESPLITRIRAYLADGSKASMERAADLLERGLAYARSSRNVWREVELLAIQALALQMGGRHEAALDALDHALALAAPGHFVRSFIDLGPQIGKLLAELVHHKQHAAYARELLSIIEHLSKKPQPSEHRPKEIMIEPLTAREMEILNLLGQYLSNDEIAQALYISPVTVKSHIRNLFEKMGVNRRRFAIMKGKEMGLLP
jgi:LuxR family maltose regulon positive regulatory protein